MAEYTIVLKQPDEPDMEETAFNEDTALNMADRWEGKGEGRTAEVRDPGGNVLARV